VASNNQIAATMGLCVTLRSMIRVLRSCSDVKNILRGRMKIKGIRFYGLLDPTGPRFILKLTSGG
jgi:hypothetical protein